MPESTQQVEILDFTEQEHTNTERDVTHSSRTASMHGRRSVIISKTNQQVALTTLRGLEDLDALRPDENGQSNAEIYLQRLILVNQMEGPESPARKALNCLFNRDGSARTDLSESDIATIRAGVEYSIQHTTTMGNRTVMDYVAPEENQASSNPSDNQNTETTSQSQNSDLDASLNSTNQIEEITNVANNIVNRSLHFLQNAQNITNIDDGAHTSNTSVFGAERDY